MLELALGSITAWLGRKFIAEDPARAERNRIARASEPSISVLATFLFGLFCVFSIGLATAGIMACGFSSVIVRDYGL